MIIEYNMFLVIAGVFISLIVYFIVTNEKRNALKEFPEPPKNFIFGHVLQIKDTTRILSTLNEFVRCCGPNVRLLIGPDFAPLRVALLSMDYRFVEYLLSSNRILKKTENYYYLEPWLGLSLLISDGDKWRKHRKIITPTFHFEILKHFVRTFESVGDIFIQKLSAYNNSPSFDLYQLVTLCTLDAICETAMGVKINTQKGLNLEYIHCVREMCRIVITRALNPIKIFKNSFKLTKDYHIQKRLLKILHSYTLDIITKRKERMKIQNTDYGKKVAFLDLLLKFSEEGDLLTNEEIREETDTFMFEGHDTTASAISFVLFCLANHPEVQEKVLQEQQDLFGDEKNPFVTYQELQDMKYLEMVIKESLRLYPPVPIIGRYTTEDILFDNSVIPKNTNIIIPVYSIHRNPKYFPKPDSFTPERFENFNNSLPYIYIPFSAGPRNCIGQKFAMLEMKSIVSKVIRHFELLPAVPYHSLVLSVEIVLKSRNGIKVGLKKR